MEMSSLNMGWVYGPSLLAMHASRLVEAAQRQMQLGANFTRTASIEVEAAERLLEDGSMEPRG